MSMQYGIKECLDLQFIDYVSSTPLAFADYASLSEIDNTTSRLEISGGRGNQMLLAFDHSKKSSLKLKLVLTDLTLLSLLSGDTLSTAAQNVLKREVLTVSGGTATLSATPVSGTSIYVYYLNGTRDNGSALTNVASTPTAGQYSITNNVLTLNSSDNSKQIVVWYSYSTPSSTSKYSMTSNKFIQPLKIVGTGLARDQVTGVDRTAIFTIYNCRPQGTFNLTMSATAATEIDLTVDMYAQTINGNNVYYDVVFLT